MSSSLYRGQKVAVIVPCHNEEVAVARVVCDFRLAMPEASVVVFDNNSADRTAELARAAGAEVIPVALRGKGNVVRRMFADVEADIYVMVDGDATYDAVSVHRLVDKLLDEHLDMVVGCRETPQTEAGAAYRRGHQWGNRLLTGSVAGIFGGHFTDMLSGYRAFSRRYAKSFPAASHGFETETELTVHALELRMACGEVVTPYGSRPEGSESKLSTYRDGWRILKTIGRLYLSERPLAFFGGCALLLAVISLALAAPVFVQYLESGAVPRLPTAVLSAAMMISAMLSLSAGMVLDNVTRGRHEVRRLAYLAIPATRVR
ncbi:glycosyltransferase involved in cell wall biosynthesis [Variovorax boronicumulans]|uniref:Glycosyltransferase involved in cell wall biosynthesis n=1 Tax=Variovorax boronicumulans TaxID=436515 RepID=A0AAW8DRI3_9BURK|nr:glycosyltransferase [Variovorax boronicumulans]MDP9877017.1 glycosyltransferase involved in cell wall biosynthesis [Variovorax boronicumulans]MDP9922106.1 glycosyltransferase involved in cell wall biosynthesis [Variovorax boronicumulans]